MPAGVVSCVVPLPELPVPPTVVPDAEYDVVTVLTPVPPSCQMICVNDIPLVTLSTLPTQPAPPVSVGIAPTLTVTVAVLLHIPLLPATVYVVVVVGFALTLVPVVADKPLPGDHV